MSSTLTIKAAVWLFDFDNTLAGLEKAVDWGASRLELEPMLREAGCPEELFAMFPRGNLPLYNELYHRLQNNQFSPILPAQDLLLRASHIIEKFELAGADAAPALPGTRELLTTLSSRRVPMAIVTSNSSHAVERWLVRNRLSETMSAVIGRDSLLPLKPAPDMLQKALSLRNMAGGGGPVVFVGDSDSDLEAARAAGVEFIGIGATSESRARLQTGGAQMIFESLSDILQTLSS